MTRYCGATEACAASAVDACTADGMSGSMSFFGNDDWLFMVYRLRKQVSCLATRIGHIGMAPKMRGKPPVPSVYSVISQGFGLATL
jgi:hypothetical protein